MTAARTDDEKRAQAVAVYAELGLAEAHRQTGVPKSTLRRWAQAEGLDTKELAEAQLERMQAAQLASEARIAVMRAELKEDLLLAALTCVERVHLPHTDFRGKDNTKIEFDQAPAASCAQYAIAAGTFLDKFRLENGESTDRSEHLSGELGEIKDAVRKQRDELKQARDRRAS